MDTAASQTFIKWFADITIGDIPLVGGKNASLGEMVRELAEQGREGARRICHHGRSATAISSAKHGSTSASGRRSPTSTRSDMANLSQRGHAVRQAILSAHRCRRTCRSRSLRPIGSCRVTAPCRSMSPCARRHGRGFARRELRRPAGDLSQCAGRCRRCWRRCKRCFASLFTDRAITYRVDKGFDHFKVALVIGVQRMVRSDLACFGRDVHHRYRDRISRRGADQRRLRPRRKRRAGLGQSGRVLSSSSPR